MAKPKFNDPKFAAIGRNNLKDAASALTEAGVSWWIEAGTFLGCSRDDGFIQHDNDIDLGVLDPDRHGFIHDAMLARGFELKHRFGKQSRGLELSYVRGEQKVDIFFFYHDVVDGKEVIWHAAWRDRGMIRLQFEADAILPARPSMMEGVEVFAPRDTVRYLTARYGKDYHVPNPAWRWDLDPKCIDWSRSDWKKDDIEAAYPRIQPV